MGQQADRLQVEGGWAHFAQANTCEVRVITAEDVRLYVRPILTMATMGVALVDEQGVYRGHTVRARASL